MKLNFPSYEQTQFSWGCDDKGTSWQLVGSKKKKKKRGQRDKMCANEDSKPPPFSYDALISAANHAGTSGSASHPSKYDPLGTPSPLGFA